MGDALKKECHNGSELHRLKSMDYGYDPELFNRLYKTLKPLVKKLARNVDERRFNVSKDIIQSYFWDKFLFVFNKYNAEYDENRLKATLISSLSTYKNRLLRNAYTKQAEYNQSVDRLEDLFDDSKELVDDSEEQKAINDEIDSIYTYMKSNLSPDAYLLFEIQLDPPAYIKEQMKTQNSKISNMMLLDFFELRRTKANANFISKLRAEIDIYTEKAKTELKKTIFA